jgi:tetratricopeptide (TPR) repeat protein
MKRQKERPARIAAEPRPVSVVKETRAWIPDWVLGLLLVAATILAYQPVWHAGFIWDDDGHITAPELRSVNGLARIWMQPGATQQYYPLVHSVFWVEHRLWGDTAADYHWVNILLHALSALLLVKMLRQLKIPGAWLAAGFFALHPVEVESVAWISELKNTLSGAFYLGAALFYLGFDRKRNWGNYVAAFVLFGLALMSKTVVATLPAALLVIFWWQRGKLLWKQDVLPVIPFFAAGAGAGLFTAWMERTFIGAKGAAFNFSLIERCLIAGRAVWFYLGKIFWPVDLAFNYPRWNVSQAVWWQYLFPLALLVLLGVLAWRRWRGTLAALLFFIGTLFPALGFFNVYPFRFSFVADHFQYLASLGPLTLLAAGISSAPVFFQKNKTFERVAGAILLLTLGILTWNQGGAYASEETLWQAAASVNPNSWLAQDELGYTFLQKGDLDAAISHYEKAVELNPGYVEAHIHLGNCFDKKRWPHEAISQYQKALETNPNSVEANSALGNVLMEEGKADEAIERYQKAVEFKPKSAEAHSVLGDAFLKGGNISAAIGQFQKALQIDPDNVRTQNNLAWTLATSADATVRNGNEAVALATRANELTGDKNPIVLHTLAAALAEAGRFPEATGTAQRAMDLAEAQSKTGLVRALQSEMKLYEAGSAFHTPAQAH